MGEHASYSDEVASLGIVSHISVSGIESASTAPESSFLLMQTLGGREWLQYLSHCHSCERPELNSVLLTLA